MQKRLASWHAALVLLLLLAGCSLGQPDPVTDGDHGPGNVQGTTQSPTPGGTQGSTPSGDQGSTPGSTTTNLPSSTDIPADFPLPVYSDWSVLTIGSFDVGGGVRWSASFEFGGDIQGLTERYAAELQALGYTVEITEVTSTAYGIEVAGMLDDKPVDGLVSIGRAGDRNVITITFGAPV